MPRLRDLSSPGSTIFPHALHGAYDVFPLHANRAARHDECAQRINDPKVSALVYVAARAPDAGEDFGALAATFSKPPASAGVIRKDGFFWLSEEAFLRDFAGDIEPSRARALYAVQGRGADALPGTRTTTAAWRVKPTWYQVSTEDRTIAPELERFLAKRMKATTIELNSSHVSLVSHPKELADLIIIAAGRDKSQ
jgi:pimeloyl-ACP methyl ester carboxylesterase